MRTSRKSPSPAAIYKRWIGETRFELRDDAEVRALPPPKARRKTAPTGTKRKAEEPAEGELTVLPQVPELEQPGTPRPATSYPGGGEQVGSSSWTGGHQGPHRDQEGPGGRTNMDGGGSSSSSSTSSSSSGSEELIPATPQPAVRRVKKHPSDEEIGPTGPHGRRGEGARRAEGLHV